MVYTLQDGAIGFIISAASFNPYGLAKWYYYDRLGSVMDLVDENGRITASYDQDAFGNVLEGNPSGYHLTTKEFSPPIGLYYFYMRWYDPQLGRFNQKDLILKVWEHYKFCGNSPTVTIDPSGLIQRFPNPADSSCPLREINIYNDPDFCWSTPEDWLHPNQSCYREVTPQPGPGRHCCYQNGQLVEGHIDDMQTAVGRQPDGRCRYDYFRIPEHFFCDVLGVPPATPPSCPLPDYCIIS